MEGYDTLRKHPKMYSRRKSSMLAVLVDGGIGGDFQLTKMPQKKITQLQPFNEHRFDDCIAFLAVKHGRALSLYEMVKLHVMIDVYHTLDRGRPVIGGTISPFTNGPVSRSAKGRVTSWQRHYEARGEMPEHFIIHDDGERLTYEPKTAPDEDDFSAAELEAMDHAWRDVVDILDRGGFKASQEYFHHASFIGRAWRKAKNCGGTLTWDDIIDEYDRSHSDEDHSRLKTLIRF